MQQLQELIHKPHNIRNVLLFAGVKQEKATVHDLFSSSISDTEKEYLINMNSIGCSFVHRYSISAIPHAEGSDFLINLVADHKDYSHDISDSLRLVDGCLYVIDVADEVRAQTENIIKLVSEQVVPVIILDKVDIPLQQYGMNVEEVYQFFREMLDSINLVLSTTKDDSLGDVLANPEKGSVCFCCSSQGWGFTLNQFAKMYSKSFGVDENKITQRLWGDNYFDSESKKWTSNEYANSGNRLQRAFCKFVLEPITKLYKAAIENNMEQIDNMTKRVGVILTDKMKELSGNHLFVEIMKAWLPAEKAIKDMIVQKLPSPAKAQSYRTSKLYSGPQDDISATSMIKCSADGPLVMYVSKLVFQENKRFASFGRIFSGTVVASGQVRIMGSQHEFGKKDDLYVRKVMSCFVMARDGVVEMTSIPTGNICALTGVDQFIFKVATLATDETTHPLVNIKHSRSNIVQVEVESKIAAELPKMMESLKRLAKSDPFVSIYTESSGAHVISCTSEEQLEHLLKAFDTFSGGLELRISELIVPMRETVTKKSPVCLSKSPNKHSRLYCTCEPLEDRMTNGIEMEEVNMKQDAKTRASILVENYGWEADEARKIWTFAPESEPANVLVDTTKGVQYLHEIKDATVAAFMWATKEGVLAEENMRGVRYNIVDVMMYSDAVHRGGGQTIPMAKRCFYACQLTAEPRIMEPVYVCDITCPSTEIANVYWSLNYRRAVIIEEQTKKGSKLALVRAYVPVVDSFGLSSYLKSKTNGQSMVTSVFDHWKMIPSDPLDDCSRAAEVVAAIRKRKGLSPQIPELDRFLDKL